MQDEASIYTIRIIKRWLANNGIEVMDWPLYSLDLNLIEHIWRHLKEWIHEHYPKLETLISDDEIIKIRMIKTLQKAWNHLNDEFLNKLIKLMKDRIQAIIKIDG